MPIKLRSYSYFILILLLPDLAWAKLGAMVFPIQNIQKTDSSISCTITLFKYNNTLKLVTSAHCVQNPQSLSLFIPNDFAMPSGPSFYQFELLNHPEFKKILGHKFSIKVSKFDKDRDLAQVEIPDGFEFFLESLDNIEIHNRTSLYKHDHQKNLTQSLASWGYVKGQTHIYYSSDICWQYGLGHSEVTYLPTGKSSLPNLIQLNSLKVDPGMSGGAIVNYDGELKAIIKGLVPYQYFSLAISIEDTVRFLDDPSIGIQDLAMNQFRENSRFYNSSLFQSHQSQMLASDNQYQNGGDNNHADGGDFSTLQIKDQRFWTADIFTLFETSEEGIPCPFDKSGNLLIIGIKKDDIYYQVDGFDDYLLNVKAKTNTEERIHRYKNGYIEDEDLREEIFERMEGKYSTLLSSVEGEPTHAIFLEDEQTPEKYKRLLSGQLPVNLSFSEEELTLDLWSHPLMNFSTNLDTGQMEAVNLKFKVEFSYDHRLITLTNKYFRFRCENKYLLKLICEDRDSNAGLSLSLNNTLKYRELKFRLFYQIQYQNKSGVVFYYGTLHKSSR